MLRNPPFQTGELSPPHSSERTPSAHDKSPTHTQSLSLLPPTATFTHRQCLCVCAYVSWAATFSTRHYPQTERNHREGQWERERQDSVKKKKKKSDGGHKNMLVSNSYATNVMKWLMGRVFVLKHFPLLGLYSPLCQKSPMAQHLATCLCSFPRGTSWSQLSVQHRFRQKFSFHFLPLDIMWHTVYYQYGKNLSVPFPVWATKQQEWACACACMRSRMFTFSLCWKHMDRVGMCRGRRVAEGGSGDGRRQ